MARWKLTAGHYLNVPGTEWEYRETNTEGKQARKVFNVPMFLNPDDKADQNYPGEIIVAQGASTQPRDIIFVGKPTPEMLPLDAEAQALTDAESHKWLKPVETFEQAPAAAAGPDLTQVLRDIAAMAAGNQPSSTVPKAEFDALASQVATLTAKLGERRI